jgi:hypothetical protein
MTDKWWSEKDIHAERNQNIDYTSDFIRHAPPYLGENA